VPPLTLTLNLMSAPLSYATASRDRLYTLYLLLLLVSVAHRFVCWDLQSNKLYAVGYLSLRFAPCWL